MKRERYFTICWIAMPILIFPNMVVLNFQFVKCQDSAVPIITAAINAKLANLTPIFRAEITKNLNFCIMDFDADWDGAFDFTKNPDFIASCIKKTKGDLPQRLCTAAELKFYFEGLFERSSTGNANFLKLNSNCNLTSWVDGCEPGWACSVGANQKIDMKDKQHVPSRTSDCQPCCEGFFCPQGLTCMMPCPLGAYCPLAKLNQSSGVCEPYHYQLPPGRPNHTCGGANFWSDVRSSNELFCSAGSFCPSTSKEIPCTSGHYCRMGSTSETKCFKLASCGSNTANQDITAYGVILFASLSALLIIFYNCSDQVLTTRERRQAKSREEAARSARETAQARERWKFAKEVAKKGAIGLQSQFSRTFSRKKSTRSGSSRFFGLGKSGPLPPSVPKTSKRESSNLTKMMKELEENPDTYAERKQMHTQSQIFKYAYGQLEKEKALQQQNKNLTFSGVISMAADIEIRPRPVIEVAFKDLTLTLKGKHIHLLRSVTGKIMPGRVSAVMGPSGAGKTTFLSALAGKVTGCVVSGLVLINGKIEPIHSYKKIIGFVPQDDIVHGNLTVEENLWFSARYRLSADLSKPDKVLVVERVIEALGLQGIRESLVGTVERRGISGGQRKRVNVGLEMVMEPSLLILDEPTSGLDSSEGVNICMVVHQPSYALFKMFDDLILLAKDGLTVYHGPVKKVEEYFSSLGINVPDRINPPDYFIDILEGIVKPTGGTSIKQLPIRWMLHNGYKVPPDMLQIADAIASSTKATGPTVETEETSFAGELWKDVKTNVEIEKDLLQHNFLKSKDLSNRVTPGVLRQYRYFLGRVTKQRLREARIQAVDVLLLLLAGICLGTLAKVSDETFGALGYTYTVIAVSLLSKIAALRSFALDKLIYRRERASGMSSLAYFLSKDTIDHFNTLIKPVVYLSMFYFFNNPRSSFTDNYIILVCLVYCVTGIAYVLAIFLEPSPAQLWSVLLPVVLTLIATQDDKNDHAFVIANAKRYSGVWLITRCGSLTKSGYDLHDWGLCIAILLLWGVVSRLIAFFCLVTFLKK
ncbi:hypothetical protein MKX01_020644 [Papaver californicum]|nr:hypothetical protein MKX01_020644 [Papaver californicum]